MSNDLSIIYNNGDIRIVLINNEPWWVLNDLCSVLGIGSPQTVLKRLDRDGVVLSRVGVMTGKRADGTVIIQEVDMNVIDEGNMYEMVMRSDKPLAVKFRRWVVREVLPQIRITGGYDPTVSLESLKAQFNAEKTKNELVLSTARGLVDFVQDVHNTKDLFNITQVAQYLSNPHGGFVVGRNNLFKVLRVQKVLYKDDKYNMPYQKYMDAGWFYVRMTRDATITSGSFAPTIFATGKGVHEIHSMLNKLYRSGELDAIMKMKIPA